MAKTKETALFARLRLRLTLVCTLATGIILLAASGAALAVSESQLAAKEESSFQSEVNAALYHLRGQTVVDHTWLAQTEAGGSLILYVELSGQPLLYGGGAGNIARTELTKLASDIALQEYGFDIGLPPTSRYQPEQQDFILREGADRWRVSAVRLPQERGWTGLLVLRSMEGEAGVILLQRMAFGGFVAAALGLLALFAWLFTGRALGPIEEIRRRQTAFIAAASHELRSPLAVIRASLSALRGVDGDKAKHFTGMADSECVRMSRLVGDMLSLANADSGTWSIHPQPVEPETLLLEAAEQFESVAGEKGLHLHTELPEGPLPRCHWDGQRILQLLAILVDNGVSYTPAGGSVRLSGVLVGERVRLTVADSGPGIPDSEKPRVFERFYRADSARTEREHYGLGLCIAREIAELHHGTIALTDNPGGGAVFSVTLPI